MPKDCFKTIAAAASRPAFRIGLVSGRTQVPDDCDEAVELRQARAAVLVEYHRMNVVRREMATAPMSDEQRAEHTINVTAELRALRGDFRVLGNLLRGLLKRRRAALLSASDGSAAQ